MHAATAGGLQGGHLNTRECLSGRFPRRWIGARGLGLGGIDGRCRGNRTAPAPLGWLTMQRRRGRYAGGDRSSRSRTLPLHLYLTSIGPDDSGPKGLVVGRDGGDGGGRFGGIGGGDGHDVMDDVQLSPSCLLVGQG